MCPCPCPCLWSAYSELLGVASPDGVRHGDGLDKPTGTMDVEDHEGLYISSVTLCVAGGWAAPGTARVEPAAVLSLQSGSLQLEFDRPHIVPMVSESNGCRSRCVANTDSPRKHHGDISRTITLLEADLQLLA